MLLCLTDSREVQYILRIESIGVAPLQRLSLPVSARQGEAPKAEAARLGIGPSRLLRRTVGQHLAVNRRHSGERKDDTP